MTCQLALWAPRKSKPLALPTAYLAPVSGRGCKREVHFFLLSLYPKALKFILGVFFNYLLVLSLARILFFSYTY